MLTFRTSLLDPIDWKSVDYSFCMPKLPWVNGREMAGIVEYVGSEVEHVQVGQRVWTSRLPGVGFLELPMLIYMQAHTIETAEQVVSRNLWLCLVIP